jgi:hypothetical protein
LFSHPSCGDIIFIFSVSHSLSDTSEKVSAYNSDKISSASATLLHSARFNTNGSYKLCTEQIEIHGDFESLWFYKCEVRKGLSWLFGDVNILLQAAYNLGVIREPDYLTHASGKQNVGKCQTCDLSAMHGIETMTFYVIQQSSFTRVSL